MPAITVGSTLNKAAFPGHLTGLDVLQYLPEVIRYG